MEALRRYAWPGNIRELQNVVERAVILSNGGVLRIPDLPKMEESAAVEVSSPPLRDPERPKTLQEAEREHISEILRRSNWVLSGSGGAAVKLGIPRTTLLYKMRQLGIPRRPQ